MYVHCTVVMHYTVLLYCLKVNGIDGNEKVNNCVHTAHKEGVLINGMEHGLEFGMDGNTFSQIKINDPL